MIDIFSYITNLGFNVAVDDSICSFPIHFIKSRMTAFQLIDMNNDSFCRNELTAERNRHKIMLSECEENSVRLIQVFSFEWDLKNDITKSVIDNKLGVSNRIFVRNCEVCELDGSEHKKFMDLYHIQGGKGCNVAYGLKFGGDVVSVMSFNKHPKYDWEITRFANKLNYSVVGGASRLFKRFLFDYKPEQVLTYADRRYSDGNLYKKLGFKLSDVTTPNYFYIKNGNIYSRQQFQKHKLKDKLDYFDSNLTESDNMFINGYCRLWDSGHYRFLLT